jgi:hypothetical protein
MPTNEQLYELLRDLLRIGGTIAGMAGVAQGIVDSWTSIILSVGGPLIALFGIAWGVWARTRTSMVASVSALPETKGLTLSDPNLVSAAKQADPDTKVTLAKP